MLENDTAIPERETSTFIAALGYIKARLAERSTWAGIIGAIGGGCAFASPWSYVAVASGVIAVFVPEAEHDANG